MKKNLSKGFTLIELLVVIAIIGILAALVLVSLGNARSKAQDARVKSNIAQLKTLAEIHYDSNNASYAGLNTCFANPPVGCQGGIAPSVTAIFQDNPTGSTITTQTNGSTLYCVSAQLVSDTSQSFCVDSTGDTGTVACQANACP